MSKQPGRQAGAHPAAKPAARKKARTPLQRYVEAQSAKIPPLAPDAPRPPTRFGVMNKVWSRAETDAQMATLETFLLATLSRNAINRAMRDRFGVGAGRVGKLIVRVHAQWAEEDVQSRPHARASQIRRIMSYIDRAQRGERAPAKPDGTPGAWITRPDLKTAAVLEGLLADLQGTRQPIEVKLNVRMSAAAQEVIGAMTGEEIEELLEEARTESLLADRARKMLGTGQTIDVTPERVSP